MLRRRSVGNLSSLHLIRIAHTLRATAGPAGLDPEAKRRLREFLKATTQLAEASPARAVDPGAEQARVRPIDEKVDRTFFVLRDVLRSLARVAGEVAVGDEAARVERRLFPNGVEFTRLDGQAQLEHGKAILADLATLELSSELGGVLRALAATLEADHVRYQEALDEALLTARRAAPIKAARDKALAALAAFTAYVETMATSDEARARADALLFPVDTLVAKVAARRLGAPIVGDDASPDAE